MWCSHNDQLPELELGGNKALMPQNAIYDEYNFDPNMTFVVLSSVA
jgi:hypothetical protein